MFIKFLTRQQGPSKSFGYGPIITTDLFTLTPDLDITRAAGILLGNRINGAPVVDQDDHLVGILCQSDLIAEQKKLPIPTVFTFLDSVIQLSSRKQIEKQVRKIAALTVSQAMSRDVITVHPVFVGVGPD